MSSIFLLNTLFLIIETLSSSNDNTDFQYKMNTISLLESFEWLDGFTIILQQYTSTSAQHLWAALNS